MKDTGNVAIQVTLLYLLWFASCALTYPLFVFLPNALRSIAASMGADQWTLPAVHRFSILGLLVLAVIFIFWTESSYRRASKIGLGRLLRSFFLVTSVQVAVGAVGYLVPLLLF